MQQVAFHPFFSPKLSSLYPISHLLVYLGCLFSLSASSPPFFTMLSLLHPKSCIFHSHLTPPPTLHICFYTHYLHWFLPSFIMLLLYFLCVQFSLSFSPASLTASLVCASFPSSLYLYSSPPSLLSLLSSVITSPWPSSPSVSSYVSPFCLSPLFK